MLGSFWRRRGASRSFVKGYYTKADLRQNAIRDRACVANHVRYMRNSDHVHWPLLQISPPWPVSLVEKQSSRHTQASPSVSFDVGFRTIFSGGWMALDASDPHPTSHSCDAAYRCSER
jgi:hypothetical protein